MGSPSAPQNPYTYGSQANNYYGQTLGQNYNLAQQGNPYTQNILQNPYASGYQSAAGQAGGLYGQLSPLASGASGALYGAGNAALGAGQQILQAGFDPQRQLYSQVQNQNSQQNLAGLANLGVAATPYGAGVAGQENTNFNLDWQNNQLQREATAAQAYGGLNTTAQNDFSAGGQQGQLGADAALMAGQLPYATSIGIDRNALGALGTQQGLESTAQLGAANYLQSSFGAQQQSWQDQMQQNQSMWGGIGSLLGLGVDAFGGGGSSGGGWLQSLFGGGNQMIGQQNFGGGNSVTQYY
jgi:hypothetical protein